MLGIIISDDTECTCIWVTKLNEKLNISRVAMVWEKYLENEFFSRSGNFVDGQGNLERTWKVREK